MINRLKQNSRLPITLLGLCVAGVFANQARADNALPSALNAPIVKQQQAEQKGLGAGLEAFEKNATNTPKADPRYTLHNNQTGPLAPDNLDRLPKDSSKPITIDRTMSRDSRYALAVVNKALLRLNDMAQKVTHRLKRAPATHVVDLLPYLSASNEVDSNRRSLALLRNTLEIASHTNLNDKAAVDKIIADTCTELNFVSFNPRLNSRQQIETGMIATIKDQGAVVFIDQVVAASLRGLADGVSVCYAWNGDVKATANAPTSIPDQGAVKENPRIHHRHKNSELSS